MSDFHDLDVVELVHSIGRWPAGTIATVIDHFPGGVVLEMVGPSGEALDIVDVSLSQIRPAPGGHRMAHAV